MKYTRQLTSKPRTNQKHLGNQHELDDVRYRSEGLTLWFESAKESWERNGDEEITVVISE